MGKGFWILTWDGWGNGLDMNNPRMVTDNGSNWFTYKSLNEKSDLIKRLTADLVMYKVIE